MQLTDTDKSILRCAAVHGCYRPTNKKHVERCVKLAANNLLRENDNNPGCYATTRLGDQVIDALEPV